jgi:hypothetical protein
VTWGTNTGAGVTVTSMKEEQSASRLARDGLRLTSVPLTPRKQLFALHSLRAPRPTAKALLAVAKARKSVEVLIFGSERCN